MTLEALEQYFEAKGQKKYKAVQIYDWLYQKRVTSFEQMTNLKGELIQELKKEYCFEALSILKREQGENVYKYLFELEDHNKVEAVLMQHTYGMSLCLSSQVGCNMTCAFCESGRQKKVRNLEAYEMVLQILTVEADLQCKITHIVVMGIGEPFDNYENLISFIQIINAPKGMAFGSRHITVSTCGIVPKIEQFIQDGKQVNLAISLHAPNDILRSQLMPINKAYPLKVLIQTISHYIAITNRRVTFEYIMLKDMNDSLECAKELSILLKGMNCYVNLIPYNETSHIAFKRSKKETMMQFYDYLKKHHIAVTIRKEFGGNVKAACGQLRANYEEEQK